MSQTRCNGMVGSAWHTWFCCTVWQRLFCKSFVNYIRQSSDITRNAQQAVFSINCSLLCATLIQHLNCVLGHHLYDPTFFSYYGCPQICIALSALAIQRHDICASKDRKSV